VREFYNDIINIRRMVFAAIARIAYEDEDLKKLGDETYLLIPGEKALALPIIMRPVRRLCQ